MTTMRVADYIVERLAHHGARHVFMVTGGGAMHLNDAFGRSSKLDTVCMHHEQACAMAAESYCRLSRRPAIVNVTTGPGGINALNGVFGAYTDSIAMIVVSGQVKRETMSSRFAHVPLRQLGDQEVDIVRIVGTITKYAVVLDEPSDVRRVVDRAFFLATSGRPGPVWIDVPIDIQGALVDVDTLDSFDAGELRNAAFSEQFDSHEARCFRDLPQNTRAEFGALTGAPLAARIAVIVEHLGAASRPVILVGNGVRISGAHQAFLRLVERLGIPVTTAWNAHDAISSDHPCFVGRPGTVGDRAGNFAVQSADFLLTLGCRLNIRQISYNWSSFAPHAWKAMIDIDPAELSKPTLSIDWPVHADLVAAIDEMLDQLPSDESNAAHLEYRNWCKQRQQRYPVVLAEYRPQDGGQTEMRTSINPYYFVECLFSLLEDDDIIVTGDGTACVVTFQAACLKAGQRLYTNSGCASMGYDLPAAIGAHFASGRRIVCLAGDGSVMMNLQELQTIAGLSLPIKVFVINNNGYHSIRQTQNAYFPDNEVGVGPQSGVTFPDFVALAKTFGLAACATSDSISLADAIRATLAGSGPALCEVFVDIAQAFAPKLVSRRLPSGVMVSPELDDMHPFLSREELQENRRIQS